MMRVWMILLPWLMLHADELIAWWKQRNAVKRCGGLSGRNLRCDREE